MINKIDNKKKNNRKKSKNNDTFIGVLLLVLVFTSFFVLIYMNKLKRDVETSMIIDGRQIKVGDTKDVEVSDLYHKSYIEGYSDNTFRPNQNITRAEVANIIASLDELYNENTKYYNPFIDELGVYENSISFCSEYGIMAGTTDDMFMPDSFITRQDFLTVLARYKKFRESSKDLDITSATKSWYDTYVDLIKNEKIDNEVGDASTNLVNYITRAEACSIINRTFNRELIIKDDMIEDFNNRFSDIDLQDWYFEDVIEASYPHVAEEFHHEDYESKKLKYDYPEKHYIEFNTSLLQNPELPTGCEITALTQLLNYYGYDIDKVRMSDRYLSKVGVGESDFLEEFVGDPKSNAGFGCYAAAIKIAAERYLNETEGNKKVLNLTDYSIDDIYELVSMNYPINVWVTTNLVKSNKNFVWKYKDRSIYWTLNEHCVTLIGYDKTKALVYVADPLVGIVSYDMSTFEHRYKELGCQAIIICDKDLEIEEKKQVVTNIDLTNGIETMYVGNVYELNIIVEPPYAQNVELKWESSNTDVLSVSSRGIISANAPGKATVIISSDNGVKATLDIEVR